MVIKVGSAHAGRGKMRAFNQNDYADFKTVLQMGNLFYTFDPPLISPPSSHPIASHLFSSLDLTLQFSLTIPRTEPFVDFEFEYRIQKIGPHYRCFKRRSDGWKNNMGDLKFEDYPVTERHITLIEEAAKVLLEISYAFYYYLWMTFMTLRSIMTKALTP